MFSFVFRLSVRAGKHWYFFSVLQVMSRPRWAQWRATILWSGAGSTWHPCPQRAAPLPFCRRTACSLWLEESPRDPVTLWKLCVYQKQCDTCTHTQTPTGLNAKQKWYFIHVCGGKKTTDRFTWIGSTAGAQILFFLPFKSNWRTPLSYWDVGNSFSLSTSILQTEAAETVCGRDGRIQDEGRSNRLLRLARTENWQLFYTGGIIERQNNEQKTDTHTHTVSDETTRLWTVEYFSE